MSFDVYFRGFRAGEPVPGGGARMREALRPFIVRDEPEHHYLLIEVGDGSADVYLDDDDMLANHISGVAPWELFVRGSRAAGWTIMPVGCPPCITAESQRTDLPAGLDADAVVVATGTELIRLVQAS